MYQKGFCLENAATVTTVDDNSCIINISASHFAAATNSDNTAMFNLNYFNSQLNNQIYDKYTEITLLQTQIYQRNQ